MCVVVCWTDWIRMESMNCDSVTAINFRSGPNGDSRNHWSWSVRAWIRIVSCCTVGCFLRYTRIEVFEIGKLCQVDDTESRECDNVSIIALSACHRQASVWYECFPICIIHAARLAQWAQPWAIMLMLVQDAQSWLHMCFILSKWCRSQEPTRGHVEHARIDCDRISYNPKVMRWEGFQQM